jgi:glycogen operon protein
MVDNDFLMLINAWWEPLTFTIPADMSARQWHVVCDTHDPGRDAVSGDEVAVEQRSLVVLRSQT